MLLNAGLIKVNEVSHRRCAVNQSLRESRLTTVSLADLAGARVTLTFLEERLCQHHADEERQSQDHHRCLAAHDGDDDAVAAALVLSQSAGLGSAPVLLVWPQESECWLRVWWREVQWQELW